MTLNEILQHLHALETRLRQYEAQYGVASDDFYDLYKQGALDDDGLESSLNFTRWASAYEMKLEREQAFHDQSRSFISSLRTSAPSGSLRLTPNPELHKA